MAQFFYIPDTSTFHYLVIIY